MNTNKVSPTQNTPALQARIRHSLPQLNATGTVQVIPHVPIRRSLGNDPYKQPALKRLDDGSGPLMTASVQRES